jgi:predicted nucleotidyltransferase
MQINEEHLDKIKMLCQEHSVSTFSIFGSATREDFDDDSDIDFSVDFNEKDPFKYTDLYFN